MAITDSEPPLVTVITGAPGDPLLRHCMESVQRQTYSRVEHMVVIDGPAYTEPAQAIIAGVAGNHPVHVTQLPVNTGKDRFYGHRIYGAMPFLCRGNYVAYLDEDNWFDPDHVASLIEIIQSKGLRWAYALRKIVGQDGGFLFNDDCESLGKWPIWKTPNGHMIDTSCFMIRRRLATRFAWVWNRRGQNSGVVPADRAVSRMLMKHATAFDTSGLYTVNYRVGSTELSVQQEFFLEGNAVMTERYPDGFPWRRAT